MAGGQAEPHDELAVPKICPGKVSAGQGAHDPLLAPSQGQVGPG